MTGDRTEQPTAKRLRDAREKGQVARTREAGQAASLVAATMALGAVGAGFMGRLGDAAAGGIVRMGEGATRPLDGAEVTRMALDALGTMAVLVAPVGLAAIVTVVAAHVGQGGWVFAPQALQVNWGRLSPAAGIKRFGFSKGGVELLRTTLAAVMIAWLAYSTVMDYLSASAALARVAPGDAAAALWTAASGLVTRVAIGLLLLAGADHFVQRYQLRQSLRMSKQEVRDEFRLAEGNPEIKARVRRIQREMVKQRMLSATKKATVVITNPTHYAVALEYRRASMGAPVVVAKGQGHMALRIKAVAREHGVPTVENVQLARALYSSAEVGDTIPGPLFEAVAEVLAYLIRLKQLVLS